MQALDSILARLASEQAFRVLLVHHPLHSTSRVTLEPNREIHFTCIGGDIRACDGSWRLEPLDGGQRTRVTYDMWATSPFAVPAGLISGMMRRDVPSSLKALRRECEGG